MRLGLQATGIAATFCMIHQSASSATVDDGKSLAIRIW